MGYYNQISDRVNFYSYADLPGSSSQMVHQTLTGRTQVGQSFRRNAEGNLNLTTAIGVMLTYIL